MKKKRLSHIMCFRLSENERDMLEKTAYMADVSNSEFIRRAVNFYLKSIVVAASKKQANATAH